MRIVGWIAIGIVAGAVLGAIVVGAGSTQDVKRYVRMRKM
jgi:hypothetical protein